MALDLSYVIPIFLRRFFANHPDVMFKPGPFYMGDGWVGWAANVICIIWTLFVVVIFALPTVLPVTAKSMNYAAVSVIWASAWAMADLYCLQPITGGVIFLAL
jgi:hypothetical protein